MVENAPGQPVQVGPMEPAGDRLSRVGFAINESLDIDTALRAVMDGDADAHRVRPAGGDLDGGRAV